MLHNDVNQVAAQPPLLLGQGVGGCGPPQQLGRLRLPHLLLRTLLERKQSLAQQFIAHISFLQVRCLWWVGERVRGRPHEHRPAAASRRCRSATARRHRRQWTYVMSV